jgi:hypothetical protein
MKRAGKLLSAFFERNNIQDTQGYVDFFQSWHRIVGVDLAAHSDAVDIRNHALVVEVDHPGWMQKLHMQRERILKTLQQRYPNLEIRNIHFTLVEEGSLGSAEQRTGARGAGGLADSGEEPGASKDRATFQHADPAEPSPEERERERREEPEPSRNEKEALKKIGSERLRERLESLGRHIHERDEQEGDQD